MTEYNANDFMARYEAHENLVKTEIFPLNKALAIEALRGAGVTKATVEFSGSGDSGQLDGVAFEPEAQDFPAIDVTLRSTSMYPGSHLNRYLTVDDLIETLAFQVIDAAGHSGWENNDGASGNIVFDIEAGTIEFEIYSYYTSSEFSSETF
jgi:hypothetical protein